MLCVMITHYVGSGVRVRCVPVRACFVILAAVLLAAGVLAGGGCQGDVSDNDIRDITLTEVRKQLASQEKGSKDRILLLDARSAREFAAGHIPDARHLPIDAVSGRRGDLDPNIERFVYKVVYGNDPASPTARGVVKRLMTNGYEDVYLFRGGLNEWRKAGLPVAGGEAAPVPVTQPAAR